MNHQQIEELENKVIDLDKELRIFAKDEGLLKRDSANYNHLGTLSVNLKSLQRAVDKLVKHLNY